MSDPCQFVPANLGEIARERAVAEQTPSVFPFILAALHEIVEGFAASPRREDKLLQHPRRRHCSGPALVQGDAVEVAVHRFARVGTLTSRAELHSFLVLILGFFGFSPR